MGEKLSIMDSGWLTMESRETPMHVGGLQIYELPENAPKDFCSKLYERLTNVPGVSPPFNKKLDIPLAGPSAASWEVDDELDIEYHVRHTALPKPGRVRELLVLVSRLHGELLDRNRPLWECYVIEGLEGNRFALFCKMHHSMIDGVAGMALLNSRMAHAADEESIAPWSSEWIDIEAKGRKPRERKPKQQQSLQQRAGNSMALAKGLGKTVSEFAHMHRNPHETAEVAPYQSPKSILNVRASGARRFVADTWDMNRIKAVAKATDSTMNDVVLAMCGGCLRGYLLSQNELPSEPLTANVPVSMRTADEAGAGGNAISVIQANLGTHVASADERLNIVKESMAGGKKRLKRMGKQEIMAYTVMANMPFTIGQALPIGGRVRPMYNVVVSNVPGPKAPLYMMGAKLVANYPASLVFHGYALNITLTSYCDETLDFGFTACRRAVPGVQRMLDHLEDALSDLEAVAGIKPPTKKVAGKKSAAKPKKVTAKKAAPKKVAAKKAAAKKAPVKKVAVKSAPARKAAPKRS